MKITYSSQTGNSPLKWMFLAYFKDSLLLAKALHGNPRNARKANAKVKSHPSESVNLIQIFLAMFAPVAGF